MQTAEILDFSIDMIKDKNVLLAGDRARREETVGFLLDGWDGPSHGPLVVLDRDGSLYERFGGNGLLVDLESSNSVLPGFMEPLLAHPVFGETPKHTAEFLTDIMMDGMRIQGNNDQYFYINGRHMFTNYLMYLMGMTDQSLTPADRPSADVMLCMAYRRRYMDTVVNSTATDSKYDFFEQGEPEKGWNGRYSFAGQERREEKSADPYESGCRAELVAFLKETEGGIVKPFGNELRASSNGNTAYCVMQEARSNGRRFFKVFESIDRKRDVLEKQARLDLAEYVSDAPGVLYVVGGSDREHAEGLALLTLCGVAAACGSLGVKASCLIPDLDDWNIFSALERLEAALPGKLSCIYGVGNINEIAKREADEKGSFFDRLARKADLKIWHESHDTSLRNTFLNRSSGTDLMYGLEDLGRINDKDLVACEDEDGISYSYIGVMSEGRCGERVPFPKPSGIAGWFGRAKAGSGDDGPKREKDAAITDQIEKILDECGYIRRSQSSGGTERSGCCRGVVSSRTLAAQMMAEDMIRIVVERYGVRPSVIHKAAKCASMPGRW